jgi:hypothetical protein
MEVLLLLLFLLLLLLDVVVVVGEVDEKRVEGKIISLILFFDSPSEIRLALFLDDIFEDTFF